MNLKVLRWVWLYVLQLIFLPQSFGAEVPTVAVSQIVTHPSLDAVREGLLDHLKEAGFIDGKTMTWVYQNANGNIGTSSQIAQNLVGLKPTPNVIVAIGTPTAQSILGITRHKPLPVIFAAVTDPVSSRLVKNIKHPHGMITGIIDYPPVEEQIIFMGKIINHLKTIGIIFNPGEPNSVIVVEQFRKLAEKKGYTVIMSPIVKTTDIAPAAHKLIDARVDAIYVPQDNTVISAMPGLAAIGRQYKCPIFTSDDGSVHDGAFAALSYSYYDIGQKAGEYVVKILQGGDIKSLPITTPGEPRVYINDRTRRDLGLTIDPAILKDAEVYESSDQAEPK